MKFFSSSDKKDEARRKRLQDLLTDQQSDKHIFPDIELPPLDPEDAKGDLRGVHGIGAPPPEGGPLIFNKYSYGKVRELMEWSGIFTALEEKGYKNYKLDLDYLSDMDQRIYVKEGDQILIHIRLKLSDFRLRLHPGAPRCKLLYIDWLLTQHPKAKIVRKERLFPGQELPGLGIFTQISDFITNMAIGVGADGAFNIPEYFHDAMLFHRQFNHYDPHREAFLRAIIRDLRKFGARRISRAFAEDRILDHSGSVVHWTPAEMLSILNPALEEQLWSRDYYTKVVREIKRMSFRIVD